MPTYDYACPSCEFKEEQIHRMNESPEYRCPKCDTCMEKQFTPNAGGFIIKGGSESINWKEKRTRMKKRKELSTKQLERYGSGPQIQPNVAGVETNSWSDAAKMAKEAGLSTDSYQPMIDKEKRTSKSSNIDDKAWKKAKEESNS